MTICTRCKEEKTEEHFMKSRPRECRECFYSTLKKAPSQSREGNRERTREWRARIKKEDPERWKEMNEKKNSARRVGKHRDRTDRICRDCSSPLTPENNKTCHGKRCHSCHSKRSAENAKKTGTNKKWRAKNRAYLSEQNRLWFQKNPGARSAYIQNYRAKHPGTHYRALVVKPKPGRVTRAEWQERLEEFNHACAYCLRTGVRLSQDHMIPRTKGGEHSIVNVVPACRSCNSQKNARGVLSMLSPLTYPLNTR